MGEKEQTMELIKNDENIEQAECNECYVWEKSEMNDKIQTHWAH